MAEFNEQHFLLYVKDEPLAAHLGGALEDEASELELNLDMVSHRVGILWFQQGTERMGRPVTVHRTPTLVETYKSHNHYNLVKSGDCGQMLMVHELGDAPLEQGVNVLLGMEGSLPEESLFGVTPPMQHPHKVFRRKVVAPASDVRRAEAELLALSHGEAPDGWIIEDIAEMWVQDESGKPGRWVPIGDVAESVLNAASGSGKGK